VISTHLKRKTRHYPETSGFDYSCGNGSLSYPLPFISALTHSFVPFENHFTVFFFKVGISTKRGTRWPIWLWNALQVGRSRVRFPDGVTGIFHLHNPSGRTMALELTQPLTEMSTRNISCGGGGGKGGRCVKLTTLEASCAECLEIWEPQPAGTLRACPGL